MMKYILLVGLGGGVGSILRFLISELTHKYHFAALPVATFVVNILGCFCIGLLANLIPANNQSLKIMLMAGFCGGFTTFSAFAKETLSLMQNNQPGLALAYTVASCLIGVCAVWLGMYITTKG
ncbi:CrcB protein [Dysgonomonas sp. PH5-45]|uniref:fluoride efflux transporter CrcB n=1 Tax=unclassified Dysgonomonas TaxID=2630389 RepID=UPI00247441D5|nr:MULTISPECIES: fluoride efflux transporter CrcB [unclassified Dysgonomonas]MDH6355206.1 CrcB protein [Dysgonomonas sp. PH5-45]MDH6388068.1 CrcB protein [Dysgonomonas sp. PH5-37]